MIPEPPRLAFTVLILAAITSCRARDDHSQRPAMTCRDCRIDLVPYRTIGRNEDDVSFTAFSRLMVAPTGEYYVAPTATEGEIAVFGSDGRYVRSITRPGQGPGELFGIRHVTPFGGDSLLVLDARGLTVLRTDGNFVRSQRFEHGEAAFRLALLPDGRVILNNYGTGLAALAVLDRSFHVVRSFGPTLSGTPPDVDRMHFELWARRNGELVAVAASYRHVIEIWDTTGSIKRRFVADSDWFAPYDAGTAIDAVFRPRTASLYVDSLGQLWTSIIVPDRRLHGQREFAGAAPGLSQRDSILDVVIEVLDLQTGTLITAQRFDRLTSVFLADGLLVSWREHESGLISLELFRPQLVRHRLGSSDSGQGQAK